ncbi:MAG: redox-regulated ATPase YchF [Candidatus Geothermincolales bacterium]
MPLKAGIIGLPNSGKSTLFNALTGAGAAVAGYPFCTVDPNVGVAYVPDERLQKVAEAAGCQRMVPADVRIVDIAGLVEGAHRGEGLGNRFLAHVREVDVLIHVVRCFDAPDVSHVMAGIDPERDIDVVNTELVFADLESLERRKARIEKAAKSGDRDKQRELEVVEKLEGWLDQGRPVASLDLSGEERDLAAGLFLLTAKPVIYVANVGESDLQGESGVWKAVARKAGEQKAEFVRICAELEAELVELEEAEREELASLYGLERLGREELLRRVYRLLGLISFFTTESGEARSWPVKDGTTAVEAAGRIHTDMQRGFIRAEVIPWEEFLRHGSFAAAREAGAVRVEGRDYRVRDGDVILFRFHA